MPARMVLITPPQFEERLQDGERLLWTGQPDPAQFNRPRIVAYALLLLPCMPLFIWAAAQKVGMSLTLLSPWTLGLGLALWPVACWAMTAYVGEQTLWAAYALTDRRVMIRRLERLTSSQSRPKVDEYPLAGLRPKLRQSAGGLGTITLGFSAQRYEMAFRAIADALEVYTLLTSAQAALAPSSTEMPYYLRKPSAAPVPAAGLDAYLQRGETVLWSGGPDLPASWRAHRTAVIVLHLLIPAALGTWLEATGNWTPAYQALAFLPALALYPLWKAAVLVIPKRRRYAVTSKRVLILTRIGRRGQDLGERTLAETMQMRLIIGKNGVGTIIFEKHSQWVWHGQGGHRETYEFSFTHIPDASAVMNTILAARTGTLKTPTAN